MVGAFTMALIFPKLWGLEVVGVRWAMALSFVMLTAGMLFTSLQADGREKRCRNCRPLIN
jgi:hypothetical protein